MTIKTESDTDVSLGRWISSIIYRTISYPTAIVSPSVAHRHHTK